MPDYNTSFAEILQVRLSREEQARLESRNLLDYLQSLRQIQNRNNVSTSWNIALTIQQHHEWLLWHIMKHAIDILVSKRNKQFDFCDFNNLYVMSVTWKITTFNFSNVQDKLYYSESLFYVSILLYLFEEDLKSFSPDWMWWVDLSVINWWSLKTWDGCRNVTFLM